MEGLSASGFALYGCQNKEKRLAPPKCMILIYGLKKRLMLKEMTNEKGIQSEDDVAF